MKNILLFIIIFSFKSLLFSQTDTIDNKIYSAPERIASFPGGTTALSKFLAENIKYPVRERDAGISGTSYIKFIVEKDGSISNVGVSKGIPNGAACDSAAVRVIRIMPKWEASNHNGKKVRSEFVIPIKFSNPYKTLDDATIKLEFAHLKKANEYYKKNEYQSAITEYTEALALVPYEVDALFKRGEMYLKLGQTDEACKDWHRIQELNKAFADEMINKYCK